jgi:hypothetical protein
MLPIDLPTREQFRQLSRTRADACVSLYLETTPLSQHSDAACIELGNLLKEACRQLAGAGLSQSRLAALREYVPGRVDEDTGAVTFADSRGADSYGVVDELAGRALVTGARVLGVHKADIPGGARLAAILRYPARGGIRRPRAAWRSPGSSACPGPGRARPGNRRPPPARGRAAW